MEIADYIYFMSNGEIIAEAQLKKSKIVLIRQYNNLSMAQLVVPLHLNNSSQYSYEHYLGLQIWTN